VLASSCLTGRRWPLRPSKQAKEILDNELDAKRAAHEAHLAERAKQEERQGHKLCGQKPKAPEEKAGHKDKKVNTTDPSSKVMSMKNGFLQGYNAQAVANEDQVVVSAEVTDEQNDRAQLHPMIDATNKSLKKPGIVDHPESFSPMPATARRRTSPLSTQTIPTATWLFAT
jgi:cell division septation protein DedD